MILETLIGGGLGGVLRLAPELLKVLDRRNERKHELSLLDKNIAAEQSRAAAGLREKEISADSAQMLAGLDALKTAVASQGQMSGVKWVDALNSTVRPFLTYGILLPYVFGKLAVFFSLIWETGLTSVMVQSALAVTYTGADMGILAGVLNFWFLGRVFDKRS